MPGLNARQRKRLTMVLKATRGTMPITMLVNADDLADYEKLKRGRKHSKLVDFETRKET